MIHEEAAIKDEIHAPGYRLGWKLLHAVRATAMDRSRLVPLAVVAIALLLAFAHMYYLWGLSDLPIRADGAPEEQILNFGTAEAFVQHGFLSRGFLTDYSIDPAPNAPAVYYTHFPSLPSVIMGGLIQVGLDDLRSVRLLMIVITTIGMGVMAGFLWRHFTPWHGVAAVAFFAMDDHGVLPWADHVVFAYWLMLTFGAFWGLTHRKERTAAYWVGLTCVFLVSVINYVEMIALGAALVGLWLFNFPNLSFRRVFAAGLATAAGVGLHLIQNVLVLGPTVAAQDILYTLGNRTIAQPSRESLLTFSQEHDLVLWGVSSLNSASARFAWIPTELDYYGWSLAASALTLAVGWLVLKRRSSFLALRLGLVLGITGVSWHLIFQAHGQAYPLALLVGHPANLIFGLAAGEAVAASLSVARDGYDRLQRRGRRLPAPHLRASTATSPPLGRHAVVCCALLAAVAFSGWDSAQHLRAELEDSRGNDPQATGAAAELEILKSFRGETFWTNVTPHLVSYYTQNWVVGQLPFEGVEQWNPDLAFVTTVSKTSPTSKELTHPHYYFYSNHNQVLNLPSLEKAAQYKRYLNDNFPAVAWSEWGSIVYDLSLGPIGNIPVVPAAPKYDLSPHVRVDSTGQPAPAPARGKSIVTGPSMLFEVRQPLELSVLRVHFTRKPAAGISMEIEGSPDGQGWESIALLSTRPGDDTGGWVAFPVLSGEAERSFRLTMLHVDPAAIDQVELYALSRDGGQQ